MSIDIEETLGRELREVADGLLIPAMPRLPDEPPRDQRRWQLLLVAAAVVLIIAGAIVAAATGQGRRELEPAPPPTGQTLPTPPADNQTESTGSLPATAPTVPYVLDQRLYVDGEVMSGTWLKVYVGDTAWVAQRSDYTWWWGRGPEANELTGLQDLPPVISANGSFIAMIRVVNGEGVLTGFDTGAPGEAWGSVPVDLVDEAGDTVYVRAVTNDGQVVVQGGRSHGLLWLPQAGGDTVDLAATARGTLLLGGSAGGLIVTDDESREAAEEPYLAELSDSGELTPLGPMPPHDDVLVSRGAAWLVRTPAGTTGGEVTAIPTLEAQTVDGSRQVTLTAPDGWSFRMRSWEWENDEHLVSPVVGEPGGERLARCSVELGRCKLIDGR